MPSVSTPAQFIAKWTRTSLPERAASQEHFIDLCRLLGQPTPAEHDATGDEYTFEKGVSVTGPASTGSKGEGGFADVWWRGKFAWEYKRKGKYKTLDEAYRQLCQYREALENPPLLIVSDIARTEIHTNFTGTRKEVHEIALAELDQPENLDKLRRVFADPESFKPERTTARITETAAAQFGEIAQGLQSRGHDPQDAAHFLMKCMFCLFAEDVGLLPKRLFTILLERSKDDPSRLTGRLTELFERMRTGGDFGTDEISWFNGGLFREMPALDLDRDEIGAMHLAAIEDWASVEPAIFGTLFERSLDPSKRAQIGAHYTSRDDIMLIVEPVIMQPLRREWADVQQDVEKQLERRAAAKTTATKKKANAAVAKLLEKFLHRLATIRILDPACGSGNFLYVAIQQLLELEKQVITFGAKPEIGLGLFPHVRPTQLLGIELNAYAAELAQVVIWIGYLQWMRDNGFTPPRDPILEPLQTIECRDAILTWKDNDGNATGNCGDGAQCDGAAEWPSADFVIGNPPFLGGGYLRRGLGDNYVDALFETFDLPNFSDLCCYWFEQARQATLDTTARVGLLATQGIRGGVNRTVLDRLKQGGDIFMAWADRDWILDGAAVHVSVLGFDGGQEQGRMLDGLPVAEIHADLTADLNLTVASVLPQNDDLQFEGDKKGAKFEIDVRTARDILAQPHISERPFLACCRPWFNGKGTNGRDPGAWIVDFGSDCTLEQASQFEAAFGHINQTVRPKYEKKRARWWIHERARREMRESLFALPRYIVTVRHAPHRLFTWRHPPALPDSALVCFARADDWFLGILQSSIHVLWARRIGTQVREKESGDRYVARCFETFPMPWAPGTEPRDHATFESVTVEAQELSRQRDRWLQPTEWIDDVAAAVDAEDDFADVARVCGEDARQLIRNSAIMAAAARDARLKARTLTKLYNERPTWLRLAHQALDRAVLATYAAVDPAGGWSEDWAEVWVESGAGQPLPDGHELAARREEVDQQVLGNLLRMNLSRVTRD